MRELLRFPGIRLVVFYLVMTLSGVVFAPITVHAALVSSVPDAAGITAGDVAAVRETLQKELVAEHLAALGLDAARISARLDALTGEELEAVAADAERIQAGGDGLGTLVTLAVLVLIILLILKISDKEVIIK